jgi:hypothetical protein
MSRKKSQDVNAMRQYRKREKIFLNNSLSIDIDDFRLKGWMPVKIARCFVSGRNKQNFRRSIFQNRMTSEDYLFHES